MSVHYTPTKIEQFVMLVAPSSFFIAWVYWLYQVDFGIFIICMLFIVGMWITATIAMGIHVYLCYRTAPKRQAD
jgi:hypothetical protein